MFHHLPNNEEILNDIENFVQDHLSFKIKTDGLMFLGNGFAIKVVSPVLEALHKKLQSKWLSLLTNQDKQKLKPHITIQNKVDPAIAKENMKAVSEIFTDTEIETTGLSLWEYHNGPWKFKKAFPWKDKM